MLRRGRFGPCAVVFPLEEMLVSVEWRETRQGRIPVNLRLQETTTDCHRKQYQEKKETPSHPRERMPLRKTLNRHLKQCFK